jgi:hypothetical protein
LLWLNFLCLDAPLVALCWQLLFAHSFRRVLGPGEEAALFLTAWWIYLVDRWADALTLRSGIARPARAEFCRRHPGMWLALLLGVGLLDGILALRMLDARTSWFGLVLGTVALFYLIVNLMFGAVWRRVPIKEMATGFLFAAGTLMVLFVRSALATRGFLSMAFLFGWLCSLNCLSIAAWERDLDQAQGKHSYATSHAASGVPVQLLCLVTGLICLGGLFLWPAAWPVLVCLALSSLLLFVLHRVSVARDERTALADLVLLTPVLFLIGERFL